MTVDPSVQTFDPESAIKYRKLRSPELSGEALQVPPFREADSVWTSNLAHVAGSDSVELCGDRLASIRKLGRHELIQLASEYTGRYNDVDSSNRSTDRIVLAGHQPELFHPGVWYKSFVLSELGKRFKCQAINLIVDGDICGNTSIRFPNLQTRQVTVGTIEIAKPGPNVPYETRRIADHDYFLAFEERVVEAIAPTADQSLVRKLWPHVMEAGEVIAGGERPKIGASIAGGRHRLESEFGLNTLEVPLSLVAGTQSFAKFAKSIFRDLVRFQTIYNETLADYRAIHRIRSRSHPVPELENIDGWLEAPFWMWTGGRPERRRLFVKQVGDQFSLSDRKSWEADIEASNFEEQFLALGTKAKIAIRPKALMTTMFSRLVLCDLFLHGIGGSKYDQLTDVIAQKFFAVTLPEYLTLSATMKLPTNEPLVGRQELVAVERRMRQLEFHPEAMIATPDPKAHLLIQRKRELVSSHQGSGRTKFNHDAIVEVNQELTAFAGINASELSLLREGYANKLRASEILGSREFSFCLFEEDLIEKLKMMARIPVE